MGRTRSAASAFELMSAIQKYFEQGETPFGSLRDIRDLAKQPGGSFLAEPSPLPLGRQRRAVLELCGQSREELLHFGVLHVPAPIPVGQGPLPAELKSSRFCRPADEPKPFQQSRAGPADTARSHDRG